MSSFVKDTERTTPAAAILVFETATFLVNASFPDGLVPVQLLTSDLRVHSRLVGVRCRFVAFSQASTLAIVLERTCCAS